MKDLLIGLGRLSCPALIFAVYGPSGLEAFDGSRTVDTSGAERGRIVYLRECARCHGRAGEGTRHASALVVSGAALPRYDDARIWRAVHEGAPARGGAGPAMPPSRRVTAADAGKILAFLRELQSPSGGR